jgi:hypothetical protein
MPARMRRLLHRPFHFLVHSRDAWREAGGGSLHSIDPWESLPTVREARATGGMYPDQAEPGNVWSVQ